MGAQERSARLWALAMRLYHSDADNSERVNTLELFLEDVAREARAAALEEAAKVCDDATVDYDAIVPGDVAARLAVRSCAEAIRALATPEALDYEPGCGQYGPDGLGLRCERHVSGQHCAMVHRATVTDEVAQRWPIRKTPVATPEDKP